MHDELTREDLRLMRAELEQRRAQERALLEEVKRTRAFGDLSENFEYKAAKQAQNKNRSRMRYLENMIKTARVIGAESAPDRVGLYDTVEVLLPRDGERQTLQVVSTVRCDPRAGRVSRESPFGKALLGRRAGEEFTVQVSDKLSYPVRVLSITKGEDDGSAPLLGY